MSLTAEQLLIRNELLNDPENMGYSAAIAAEDFEKINSLLNTGSVNSKMPRKISMTKGEFLLAILPAIGKISLLSEAKQKMWDRFLSVINANEEFDVSNAGTQGLLGQGVVDGILTQEEVDAIFYDKCTRLQAIGATPYSYSWYSEQLLRDILL